MDLTQKLLLCFSFDEFAYISLALTHVPPVCPHPSHCLVYTRTAGSQFWNEDPCDLIKMFSRQEKCILQNFNCLIKTPQKRNYAHIWFNYYLSAPKLWNATFWSYLILFSCHPFSQVALRKKCLRQWQRYTTSLYHVT